MRFGANLLANERIDLLEIAPILERAGFESIWLGEHSHIPFVPDVSVQGDRADRWALFPRLPDPFVALAAVAGVAPGMRLGTAVSLIIQRDTIQLAKEVATLDSISHGRLELGIGAGWNHEEMRNHGVDPSTRHRKMGEQVAAMREIWTKDLAEYHGEFVDFGPMWSWPKPVQQPGPPVLIGGGGPYVLQRVLRYGDGWFPRFPPDGQTVLDRIPELQRLAAEAGRDPIPVTIQRAPTDQATLEQMIELGVHRANFMLSVDEPDERLLTGDEIMRRIEELAPLIERLS